MKKYIIVIISITILSILFIMINEEIYGTEKIYIADYQPSPVETTRTPWQVTKIFRTIHDMMPIFLINFLIVAIESFCLYKYLIFKKSIECGILVILMIFIPVIISGIALSKIYAFTV